MASYGITEIIPTPYVLAVLEHSRIQNDVIVSIFSDNTQPAFSYVILHILCIIKTKTSIFKLKNCFLSKIEIYQSFIN